MRRFAAAAFVLVLFTTATAHAADLLLAGKMLDMRVNGGDQRLKWIVSDPAAVLPSGADAPTVSGASLLILNPTTEESATFILPASSWSVNGAGTAYKFLNLSAPSGPSQVKIARMKSGKLKVSARATGITLDETQQGSIGIVLGSGTIQYCTLFGGTVRRDMSGRFNAKGALPPSECPGASTPTTTTSTTTTTLPTLAFCGNTTIDAGEQCDPPASDCGGGASCNADCTCPCDFLDPSVCMHPFPNDFFTVEDATTETGRRVHFSLTGMPRNAASKPIEPSDYNYSDGFSPGASVTLKVPGVDLGMTGAAPITDIERSLDSDAPIVIVNATTLEHHTFWAELDANAATDDDRALILRPAVNFDEATRYIVALRNMKDGSGATIQPNADFAAYRDNTPTANPVVEARRAHMEDVFATLTAAGVARNDLYLAWDFTVASAKNNTERLLFMRDDAFGRLGSAAPTFVVTQIEDEVDASIFRRVTGTYLVDRYVTLPTPGARFLLGPDGLPLRHPTPQQANFVCNIPRSALANAAATAVPARASIYGHGLFGSASEIDAGNVEAMGNEHNFVFCATDWIGMSTTDVPNAVTILVDLSNFPTLVDRLEQSALNALFLARLMIHPNGFASNAAFRDLLGNPVIDTSNVFYDGNSQGGIMGGVVMSVAQDITRGVLGVPGMNYSTLLTRSVDFETYSMVLYPAYPNELERPLLFALIQMLWDRGEPNGYAHHMTTDTLPNTPPHEVLLHEAFGDHQVANVTTEVEARTIGASIYQPALAPGRHSDVDPFFGIPAIPSFPFNGSAYVVWDSGTPTPPITNTPNTGGSDPHGRPRATASARVQKSEFLKPNGAVVDVCSGAPCLAP